jgi:tripartite-type tricarboxylate transporter receptor subunit TctC
MVVPYPPGGVIDNWARVFAPKYGEALGQPVVVENRAGAGGNLGAEAVAKSAPDGYSWLVNTAAQAISAALYRKLNYDPAKDLVPVTSWVAGNLIFVTPADVPVNSLKELIALAKSKPGQLNFASTGVGSGSHFAQEMFKTMTGIDAVHVPYKGDAPLFPALFTNEVQVAIISASQTATSAIKAGKIKLLAVASGQRASTLPDVPTVEEATGMKGYQHGAYVGVWVRSGTPQTIIRRIAEETSRIARMPDVAKYYRLWDAEPYNLGPEQFAARYYSDIDNFTRIARDAKIPPVE